MPVTQLVHVYIIPTIEESKIETTSDSNIYHVRVYINTNNTLSQHKQLLPQFAEIILGKQLTSFNAAEVPMYIDNSFRFICRQLSSGVQLHNLVDEQGEPLFVDVQDSLTAEVLAITSHTVESRFVENRQGATREIILNNVEIEEPVEVNPTQVANLQYLKETNAYIHPRAISNLVTIISEKTTKPPSFTKKTKSNFKKIKNYIYQHTKLWLTKNEIEIFINEMNKKMTLSQNTAISTTIE